MRVEEFFEAFDSRVDLNWYPLEGGGEAADFGVNDVRYTLQLAPGRVGKLAAMEVSFILTGVHGDDAFYSGGSSSSPTSVYGIIANALIDKLPTSAYDAVYFSAERKHSRDDEQHESKQKIYNFVARRLGRVLGWELYLSDNTFLLTRDYMGTTVSGLKHWQEILREATGDKPYPTLKRS